MAAVNDEGFGIEFSGNDNTMADAAASGNATAGFTVAPTSNRLSGSMRLGALADCAGVITACGNTAASDALFVVNGGGPSAFVAKVTADDAVNASDNGGSAPFVSIADWLHFDNEMRHRGLDGGMFPAANQRGQCIAGTTCRIWDWSLRSADTAVRDVLALPTGNDTITHRWSSANAVACGDITGAVWEASGPNCSSTFLRRAVELPGRGGNGNVLAKRRRPACTRPTSAPIRGIAGSKSSARRRRPGRLSA